MDTISSDLSTLFSFVTHEVRSDLTPISLYLQRPTKESSPTQNAIDDISFFLDVVSIVKTILLKNLPTPTLVSSMDIWDLLTQRLAGLGDTTIISESSLVPGLFMTTLSHAAIVWAYVLHTFSLPMQGSVEDNFYIFRFPISLTALPSSISEIQNKQSFALFALYTKFMTVGTFEVLERELILRLPLVRS